MHAEFCGIQGGRIKEGAAQWLHYANYCNAENLRFHYTALTTFNNNLQDCWARRPSERPAFTALRLRLQDAFREVAPSSPVAECVVCLERPAVAVLAPCGHRCVCEQHAADLVGGACPMCRAAVESFVSRVYDT